METLIIPTLKEKMKYGVSQILVDLCMSCYLYIVPLLNIKNQQEKLQSTEFRILSSFGEPSTLLIIIGVAVFEKPS